MVCKKNILPFFFFLIPIFSYSQDFEVSPIVLNFTVEPGQSEIKKVIIRNHFDKPQKFSLTISDVMRDSLGNMKIFAPGATSRSCAKWMTVNPSFIEINPNESKEAEVMMKVPDDGYSTKWAIIYVRPTEEQTAKQAEKVITAGIRIVPRITIQVFQSPNSNTRYKCTLSDFTEITQPSDTLRKFKVIINNIGDKRIDGRIYLIASNIETAQEQQFPPVKVKAFPDQSKIVELKLPIRLAAGTYSLAAIFDYGKRTALEAVQISIIEK